MPIPLLVYKTCKVLITCFLSVMKTDEMFEFGQFHSGIAREKVEGKSKKRWQRRVNKINKNLMINHSLIYEIQRYLNSANETYGVTSFRQSHAEKIL